MGGNTKTLLLSVRCTSENEDKNGGKYSLPPPSVVVIPIRVRKIETVKKVLLLSGTGKTEMETKRGGRIGSARLVFRYPLMGAVSKPYRECFFFLYGGKRDTQS